MQVTTASQHSAMGVRSRDGRSEAGISYRSRCDEVRKSQRMEWVPRAIQRGRIGEEGARTWCGSLGVADYSGSPASAGV